MRNPWAHCNFAEWDSIKYHRCFQLMYQLVKNMHLPVQDKTDVLGKITIWETNGNIMTGFVIISNNAFDFLHVLSSLLHGYGKIQSR